MKIQYKAFFFLTLIFTTLTITSCEDLLGDGGGISTTNQEQIARGLREALSVGTDTAVTQVTALNGYYNDAIIKILLPEEASKVINKLNNTAAGRTIYQTALKPIVDDLILSLNRSAEDAGKKAKPIFVDAITSITITDASTILYGTDTAATHYLKSKTYISLTNAFSPQINISLDKKLVGNQSANSIWNTFVTTYNRIAGTAGNLFLDLEPIKDPNLATYVTRKALDGLFYMIGREEKNIREDASARVTQILKDVFGKLKQQPQPRPR